MFDSSHYWEKRYKNGKTSGAGSYGRLAVFKADVLNRFISEHGVRSVIEFGCGDGAQLKLLQPVDYLGVDVSPTVLAATRALFADQPLYRFAHTSELSNEPRRDLSISLDVIYHLAEDDVFTAYMRRLFLYSRKYVMIYSSNRTETYDGWHIRHRRFTDFIDAELPEWRQVGFLPNAFPWDEADKNNTSFADFYIYENAAAAAQP